MLKKDYHMLFERLVLRPWEGGLERSDPFGLGSANTFSGSDNDLTNQSAQDSKFILSAAIKKVKHDQKNKEGIVHTLSSLDRSVWSAKTYDDLCKILDRVETIFNSL